METKRLKVIDQQNEMKTKLEQFSGVLSELRKGQDGLKKARQDV